MVAWGLGHVDGGSWGLSSGGAMGEEGGRMRKRGRRGCRDSGSDAGMVNLVQGLGREGTRSRVSGLDLEIFSRSDSGRLK